MNYSDLDKKILRILQENADLSLEEIAHQVGATKSPVWARIRKLKANGVIKRTVALVDTEKVGLGEVFFVAIHTDRHSSQWLTAFTQTVNQMPEILEVHRLAGEIDYILKVVVPDTQAYDQFYKRFISKINLFNVTSSLSMECIKHTTSLPL